MSPLANGGLIPGIDSATDKAGLGDKYDSQIDKAADGQVNKQL